MGQRFGIRPSFGMLLIVAMCLVPPARGQSDVSGEKIYRQSLRSVVWILSPKGNGFMSTGTGSLIDAKEKLILTNYHMVGENDHVIVLFPAHNGKKLITERSHYLDFVKKGGIRATVLHQDRKHDLALIKLESSIPAGAVPLHLARDSSGPGQRVHSIGNPGGSGGMWLYTSGTVRQVYHKKWKSRGDGQTIYTFEAEVVETQSPTNPGDSGGPLVNDHGELVAITQGTATGAQLISLFIDLSEVKAFLVNKNSLPKLPAAIARTEAEAPAKHDTAADEQAGPNKLEQLASGKLEMAKDLAGAGKLDKAKPRFEQIINDYPNTKAAAEAKLLLEKIKK